MTPKLYSALKWGALLGGVLAVLETLGFLAAVRGANAADFDTANCLSFFLEALMPLAAGVLAARETGERRSGLIAGLTAGAIVAVVNMITEIVVPANTLGASPDTPPITGLDLVIGIVFARATTLALGAWFGWLGGRLGPTLLQRPPPRR